MSLLFFHYNLNYNGTSWLAIITKGEKNFGAHHIIITDLEILFILRAIKILFYGKVFKMQANIDSGLSDL